MDKVITFFGYLQNYVVSGRRSGRTARGNGPSVSQEQEENKGFLSTGESGSKSGTNINKDPSGSGLGSTSAAGKDSPSGDNKDDDDTTFKDAGFLCCKVEEVKFPPSRDLDNKQETRFADVKIDARKNQALLPPVESPCLSSSKVASKVVKDSVSGLQRQPLGASPGKLHEYVSDTQDTLPSFNAAQELPPNQTEQRKRVQGEDRRGGSSLPDIFSTIGKPLVQVRQPSFYLPVPVRNKPTTLVSVTTELSPTLDDPRSPANDEKAGTKVPKLKKNKKKKKEEEKSSC